jgi:hypothetical protein
MKNVASKIGNKIQNPRSITPISIQVVHHIRDKVYLRPWTQVHQQVSIQIKENLKFKV